MAVQGTGDELDLSVEEKSVPKKKLIIIAAVVALVLLVGVAVATWLLSSYEGDSETGVEAGSDAATEQGAAQAARKPAVYHALEPAFVVSLVGRPSTLQVSMQVMTRDSDLVEFLEKNDPLIRDRMLSLLMEQEGNKLKTRAGKKSLQSKLQKEIGKIARKEGVQGKIEAVYFTSFVMQ